MEIAADQNRASACHTGYIDARRNQADLIAQQLDGASAACHRARAFGFNGAGHQRSSSFGLNRYLATLRTVGADLTIRREGHVLCRTQNNFAACIPSHLVCIDHACIAKRRAVNADRPALRENLAKIHGGVIARGDFALTPGVLESKIFTD